MRVIGTWCRLAELNCPFILTMDAYYHYTKAALFKTLLYHTKRLLKINTVQYASAADRQ